MKILWPEEKGKSSRDMEYSGTEGIKAVEGVAGMVSDRTPPNTILSWQDQ